MLKRSVITILLLAIVGLVIYYFFPEPKLPANARIDKLIVLKSKRRMLAYQDNKLLKSYHVSLGFCPVGEKQVDQDGKTPEGQYHINAKNPYSVCHKNLGISYPDKDNIATAKKLNKSTGGDIKIHGLKNGHGFIGKFHRWRDWTDGCIGVTDDEIDELYAHVSVGIPIEIRP